jgi:hypothetical protein
MNKLVVFIKRTSQLLIVSGTINMYNQYSIDVEFMRRMHEIKISNIPLSGIKIKQRMANLPIGFLNKFMPYHQSIYDPRTNQHFGLKPDGFLKTKWASHYDDSYKNVSHMDFELPIEAWVEYYRVFSVYPVLSGSPELIMESKSPQLFLQPIQFSNGSYSLYHCQSALINYVDKLIKKN